MNHQKQFGGAASLFRTYWISYGGWSAALGSPYLWISILLTALLSPLWLRPDWWSTVLNVMPNVLGFSIGGFAIFLAFGDEGFRHMIGGREVDDGDDEPTPYLQFSATFLHFIVVQVLAILVSLCAKSFYLIELSNNSNFRGLNEVIRPIWWCFGLGLFCYAILSAFATGMAIFRLTVTFDSYLTYQKKKKP